METQAQVDNILSIAGELLEFSSGNILAIPGFDIYSIQGYDSPYDIKKQDFLFQLSLKDFIDNGLSKGDTFIYKNLSREYEFSIESFTDLIDGWIEIQAALGQVTNV